MPTDQGFSSLIPMVLIFLIMYFIVFMPEQKKKKQLKKMISELKKNDQIVTSAGIHGTVAMVKDKTVILRVDDNVKMEFDKEVIISVQKQG